MLPDATFPKPGESIVIDGSPLVCEEYLRLLPQRRLACRASWRGKRVFAKLYVNRRAGKREWKKECENFQLLHQREIEIPSVLYSGVADNGEVLVLITEWLDAVEAIKDAWQHADRASLVGSIAAHLADQHKAGVVQKDLHADNLVIRQGRILTLDYGRIAIKKSEIGKKRSLNNLALMLIQLHPMDDELAAKALESYIHTRGWEPSSGDHGYFGSLVQQNFRSIRQSAWPKLFRDCTTFKAGSDGDWSWVYDRMLSFGDQISTVDWEGETRAACSENEGGSDRYRRSVSGLQEKGVVGVWFQPVCGCARLRWRNGYLTSEVAWLNAQALNYQNVPMEQPVAHLLRTEGLLRKRGIVCAGEREGVALDVFFAADGVSSESKYKVAKNLLGILDHLRWTLIGIESLESAVRVDGEEPYFPVPYNITIHEDRVPARRQMAGAWRSFSRRFAQQPQLVELFESLGFSRLLDDSP